MPGQEDELVALIPYNDKRLKPRRTWVLDKLTNLSADLSCDLYHVCY